MPTNVCVLCFEPLLKATDLNLVDGKTKVKADLEDLPFVVHPSSPYICKGCLRVVKKRKGFKENLRKTDEQLTLLYRQKCGESGFSLKRRETGSVTPRKLRFPYNPNHNDAVKHCDAVQQPIPETQCDLKDNQYGSR